MATNPMTKLWYMTLKPATNMSMLPFRQLWTEVLDFVSGASGPVSSGHHLWQDTTSPNILVMLSGYPSYGSNQAADKAYVEKGYLKRMAEFVDHGKLLQIELEVNSLPTDAEVLCIETYSAAVERKDLIEGVEIGRDGARECVWLSFSRLKEEEVKEGVDGRRGDFRTVYLRKVMG